VKLQFRISQRDVLCGDCLPRGYRFAWFDYVRGCYVAYPIGLHWIARSVYLVWTWTYRYRPCALDTLQRKSWQAGFEAGLESERLYSGMTTKLEEGPTISITELTAIIELARATAP
jgi:hypothetical protein